MFRLFLQLNQNTSPSQLPGIIVMCLPIVAGIVAGIMSKENKSRNALIAFVVSLVPCVIITIGFLS